MLDTGLNLIKMLWADLMKGYMHVLSVVCNVCMCVCVFVCVVYVHKLYIFVSYLCVASQ